MDRNKLMKNAEMVVGVMKTGYRYTLSKLEEITAFGTTELCMAVLDSFITNEHQHSHT